jgi:serine/threonine protein kinase
VNVLVGNDQQALLADFGLSRLLDEGMKSRSSLSLKGAIRGTLRWTAPECLDLGLRATKASDVYSFAITAWEVRWSDYKPSLTGL